MSNVKIRSATSEDVPVILQFIRDLAVYEKLENEAVATHEALLRNLFGPKAYAEVIILEENYAPAGFALFFHNFSTFLGKPGIYLEDLFVKPEHRGKGYGRRLLVHLAKLAVDRDCGRLEWSVLDWNEPALKFYRRLGAIPMSEWTAQRLTGAALVQVANLFD